MSQGGGSSSSRARVVPPQTLVGEVRLLHKQHFVIHEEEKKAMARNRAKFSTNNETTQLLFGACDKLLMERTNFENKSYEDHTAELHVVCRHFGVSLDTGLSDKAHQQKLADQCLSFSGYQRPVGRRRSGRGLLGLCFGAEFPPNKDWWLNAQDFLTPSCEVFRAGQMTSVLPSTLVEGDVVYLCEGLRAPCDLRVVVAAEATLVDAQALGLNTWDVRECSKECTSAEIKSSGNIVVKESWILSGSLMGIVIRTPTAPLVPFCSREMKDEEFVLDMRVPPALTLSLCRTTFTNLCTRASLVCRSFHTMACLAQVKSLVVVLSKELCVESSSISALASASKTLGKALFLVGSSEVSSADLQLVSEASGLELVDITVMPDCNGATASTAASTVASMNTTPLPSARGAAENIRVSEDIRHAPVVADRESDGLDRLAALVDSCGQGACSGAVIGTVSEVTLFSLCRLLQEGGLRPLYAASRLLYPQCLRNLIAPDYWKAAPNNVGACDDFQASSMAWTPPPRVRSEVLVAPRPSVKSEACAVQDAGDDAGLAKKTFVNSLAPASELPDAEMHDEELAHASPRAPRAKAREVSSTDQVALSSLPVNDKLEPVILVSINAKGVLVEHADCVLLKPDLACLGQALEIVTKAVPTTATGAS